MASLKQRLDKQIERVERRIDEKKKNQEAEDIEQALKYAEKLIVLFNNEIDNFLRPVETLTEEEFSSYLRETDCRRSERTILIDAPKEPKTIVNVNLFREKVLHELRDFFGLEDSGISFSTSEGRAGELYWVLEW